MPNKDFFSKVYQVARLIPSGRITSYGAIAKYIGSPQGARIVGYAMNGSSSQKKYVPAHRVVNRKGLLTGKRFFGGETTMEELLASEGIKVLDNQIQDFDKHFWDPMIELAFE